MNIRPSAKNTAKTRSVCVGLDRIFWRARIHSFCGNSSVGRAQPCQGWGRRFESGFPLQIDQKARLHRAFFVLPAASGVQSAAHGQVAEWLCSGLQSRLPRFDSGPGLQIQAAKSRHRAGFFLFSAFLAACYTLGRSVSRPFLPEPAASAILAERMISAVSPSRARIMLPASQRRYDSAR